MADKTLVLNYADYSLLNEFLTSYKLLITAIDCIVSNLLSTSNTSEEAKKIGCEITRVIFEYVLEVYINMPTLEDVGLEVELPNHILTMLVRDTENLTDILQRNIKNYCYLLTLGQKNKKIKEINAKRDEMLDYIDECISKQFNIKLLIELRRKSNKKENSYEKE